MTSRILVADDTPTVLGFLELVFERQGFEVIKAGNGEMAVELAHSQDPDILLVDVMMPGMDGLEVCRRLRSNPATTHLPILLYSATVGEELRGQALAAGADEFLGKTMHHAELVDRVRDWLASQSSPGGVGEPPYVAVTLDLVALLQVELVWLLRGDGADRLETLAVGCERGEQEALRFLETVGRQPLEAEEGSLMAQVFARDRACMQWGLGELARYARGERLAQAMRHLGARSVWLTPLRGPDKGRGAMIFPGFSTIGLDRKTARLVAVAARYAALALGNLSWLPAPRPKLSTWSKERGDGS